MLSIILVLQLSRFDVLQRITTAEACVMDAIRLVPGGARATPAAATVRNPAAV
jgi:hypothetical protein